MKSLYILLLAIAVTAVSCRTKEGEPGPAGQSDLTQQGTISGTLAYVDNQGNPVSIPFSYAYYETLSDNKFYYDEVKQGYQLNFFRRDLKDYNNYIEFSNLGGGEVNNQFTPPTSGYFDFSLVKVMSNNNLFEFYANFDASDANSTYTITNFTFNPTTGRAFYDYELRLAPSSIDYSTRYDDAIQAIVKGRVDVILNRTQTYNSPPQAALTN